MAVIQSKKIPVIKKGSGLTYIPDTFDKLHKVSNFHIVDDPLEILDAIKPFEFKGRSFISFDTETHPHYPNSHVVPPGVVRRWVRKGKQAIPQDYPFVISVCDKVNAYTIFDTVENGFENFKKLAPLFENPEVEKIAHNWKYDAHMFANVGMSIIGRVHDTVVLAKLADENRKSFELRELATHYDGGIVKFEHMVDTYKQMNKVTDYRQIPKQLLGEYANADVWNCALSFVAEYEKIEKDGLVDLYDKECELMIASYAMERQGMPVDLSYEPELKTDLQTLVDSTEAAIYEEAGKVFNINSGKQLYEVLMKLGVNSGWIPTTAKGNPSLDKKVLSKLADKYGVSIVKNILEFRKNEKLLGTYATGIYDQRDSSARVHCNINQTEATTGRMSITKPALQTLPKKDTSIRRAFIPEEDYSMWFMDLDQVEYRLFAHYAKIPSLIEAIESGHDVHAATAAMIFHVELSELLKWYTHPETDNEEIKEKMAKASDMRNKGKTINFALIYGVGIDHLSTLLGCSTTEATDLKARYFSQMPEARSFIASVHQVIKIRGFVKNFYGRRRRLDTNDCYKAPNALIQGCAADYIKSKLVNMYKYITYNNLKSKLVLIVHDEVIVMVHKSEQDHIPVLRWLLSDFEAFRCPITAGLEQGNPSWGNKITPDSNEFKEPIDKAYLDYNVYDGKVFQI